MCYCDSHIQYKKSNIILRHGKYTYRSIYNIIYKDYLCYFEFLKERR